VPDFGKVLAMFDNFDLKLLNAMQEDADRTAEQLAELVALSPSAIARRLRRLREEGAIARTVALVSTDFVDRRLRALIRVQLHDHAPAAGLELLRARLNSLDEVQLCLEVSGSDDMVLLIACRDMPAFNAFADAELAASPVVRRYETSFVKKEIKNRPAIRLDERDARG
jgi:Lrp/AsnC family leucine-responsive transcriptional regulator